MTLPQGGSYGRQAAKICLDSERPGIALATYGLPELEPCSSWAINGWKPADRSPQGVTRPSRNASTARRQEQMCYRESKKERTRPYT
jgi:hypothetical protein